MAVNAASNMNGDICIYSTVWNDKPKRCRPGLGIVLSDLGYLKLHRPCLFFGKSGDFLVIVDFPFDAEQC